MKNFFYRVFCGFFLGISIFAPGVSGSVMAVMMGIYTKLLDIVSNPFKNLKKNIIYLFPMGIGAGLSLVMFVLSFSYLFETYPKATFLLFMGLMLGNLPVIFKDANKGNFKPSYALGIACAFSLALCVGLLRLNMAEGSGANAMTTSIYYLAFSGAVAGMSSMIPGMSISMILMVLGVYDHLMLSAKSLDILVIAVVSLSFVTAMVLFSNLTKFIFKKFESLANFMVFGFVSGSLVGLFLALPKNDTSFNWLIGSIMLLVGLGISMIFIFLSKKFNKDISTE